MKARECPYCHKRISIRKCTYYFWRGTRYTIHCNHCGQEVRPLKEPIPFNYTVVAGLLTSYISMEFFLYYIGLNFVDSNSLHSYICFRYGSRNDNCIRENKVYTELKRMSYRHFEMQPVCQEHRLFC